MPCFNLVVVRAKRKSMPPEDEIEECRLLFSALADRTRLKILHALEDGGELCVCDVAHVLGMSVSAASHHLRKMRDLRILKYRSDGKMAYYSLRDPFVSALAQRMLKKATT